MCASRCNAVQTVKESLISSAFAVGVHAGRKQIDHLRPPTAMGIVKSMVFVARGLVFGVIVGRILKLGYA